MSTQMKDRFYGVTGGLAVKAPCKTAASTNITLEGEQTINGIPLVAGDRVLLIGQTDKKENGIWVVSTTDWQRAPDFDGNRDVMQGTMVVVTDADGPSPAPLPQSVPYYPQTAAEIAAGVVPFDYSKEPGFVERYGAVADDTTDCKAAFEAAIEQARHSGAVVTALKSYVLGSVGTIATGYRLSGTVDFRPVPVQLDHTLLLIDFAGVGIIAGGNANTGNNPTQWFGEIRHTGWPLAGSTTTPEVRIQGCYEQHIHVRKTGYLQHWASSDSSEDNTYRSYVTLYGFVTVQRCETLEITDDPSSDFTHSVYSGVINDIYYTLGRIRHCKILGNNYGHNNNHFYGGNFEGNSRLENPNATIEITGSCHANTFHNIRAEGYPTASLATLGAAVSSGFTITVDDATEANYFFDGKDIGVVLDSGSTHWTTVNGAPVGLVITLTDAIPSLASIGNAVQTKMGLDVTFGPNTYSNRVIQTWTSSQSHWEQGRIYGEGGISLITDDGIGNSVTHIDSMLRDVFYVGQATADDVVLFGQKVYPDRRVSLGTVQANITAGGSIVLETKRFRVFPNDIIGFITNANEGLDPKYRCRVYMYDSAGRHIDPVKDTHYKSSALSTTGTSGSQYAGVGTGSAEFSCYIISPDVWYADIKVTSSSGQASFSLAREVLAYVRRGRTNGTTQHRLDCLDTNIVQQQPHIYTSASGSPPTEGFAPVGYLAFDEFDNTTYRVVEHVETWLTADIPGSGTAVQVQHDVTMFGSGPNDLMGILNDDNYITEWKRLAGAPTGSGPYDCVATLALTGVSSIGNRVVFVKWAVA